MAHPADHRWTFSWKRTWPEVWADEFQARWGRLLARSPRSSVYHRPELVRAWAETHGAAIGAAPLVGWASDDAGREVLLPWVVVRHRGRFFSRRILGPAGQDFFGYHDPLVGPGLDDMDWAAFWEATRRSAGGACDQALVRFSHPSYGRGRYAEPCGEDNPVLTLEGLDGLDAALARCSSNHRGDVRRRLRRLAEQGEVALWVAGTSDGAAATADLQKRFFPAYDGVWRARPEGIMLDRPGVREFVVRVVTEGVPAGWAHYAALRVNNEPIAWHLGLLERGELYWWIPAHDPKWEGFSPGKVLLALLLQHGIAQGWRRLHFLTGGHRYKLDWKPESLELMTLRWHAPTMWGRLLSWYSALRNPVRTRSEGETLDA